MAFSTRLGLLWLYPYLIIVSRRHDRRRRADGNVLLDLTSLLLLAPHVLIPLLEGPTCAAWPQRVLTVLAKVPLPGSQLRFLPRRFLRSDFGKSLDPGTRHHLKATRGYLDRSAPL